MPASAAAARTTHTKSRSARAGAVICPARLAKPSPGLPCGIQLTLVEHPDPQPDEVGGREPMTSSQSSVEVPVIDLGMSAGWASGLEHRDLDAKLSRQPACFHGASPERVTDILA